MNESATVTLAQVEACLALFKSAQKMLVCHGLVGVEQDEAIDRLREAVQTTQTLWDW